MSTTLSPDREEALRIGYQAIVWPHPVPFDTYVYNFREWTVRGIMRDGECIGAAYTRDGELHVAILPEWHGRWVTRSILRELFDMPKVIARPIHKHDEMYNYLICLGFRDCGDDTLVLEK